MIPAGISPTEAAFEVIGLVNAKSIMDYLFVDTKVGAAVFLIGMLLSLWTAIKEADYSYLWGYVFMYFVLLFLFIKPMTNVSSSTSTMEQAGWSEVTTQQILQDIFIDTGKSRAGSLGLVFISQAYNSVVYGTVSAITRATQQQDFNYLKNPFIVNKVSLYLGHFSAQGIKKDPVLRKDMEDFLKSDYPQTLGRMLNNNAQTQLTKKWWPGDESVVANYDSAQRKRWENLDSRLNDYIKKQIDTWGLAGTFVNLFVDYKALKISLLSSEIGKSATQIASGEAGYGINPQGVSLSLLARKATGAFAFLGSAVGQFFSSSLAEFMIKALPYLEGYAVMIIYSLFPFTLLLCLLFRTPEILKEYFVYLFWVKSWVIIWALIHYASLYMAALQAKLASGTTSSWFFERPYFNTVTGVLLVMSPGIAWFMTKGVLSGIGEAASALTVHADKGTGKVSSKLGV